MYLNTWEEFEKAAQNLYLQDPQKVRYTMKYEHNNHLLKVKLTDNIVCLQYKTEMQQELKRLRNLLTT